VADEDIGQAVAVLQIVKQVQHLRLHRDVERGDRLVEHDQFRAGGERAGDADALGLAAGEFVRVAVEEFGPQIDRVHQLVEPLAARGALQAEQMDQRRLENGADGLARIERGDRVLEDILDLAGERVEVAFGGGRQVLALEADGAAGRPVEPGHHARQRGLAAARFADHAQRLAGRTSSETCWTAWTAGSWRPNSVRPPPKTRSTLSISIAGAVMSCPFRRPAGTGSAPRGPRRPLRARCRRCRQASRAWGQRGAKAQPSGRSATEGGRPWIASRRRSGAPSTGTQSISLRV
jgi:hypothetical protein